MITLFCLLALSGIATGKDLLFQSLEKQATLIELFTAEGCSTCPAAEEWLGRLQADPGLWKEIVPVAFHVDYWDRRGWKDRFASPAYTQRQREYSAAWNTGSPYTPAFAVNGREWRAGGKLSSGSGPNVGRLKVSRASTGRLEITYSPSAASDEQWDIHLALLGNGLVSNVRAGENAGKALRHNFTVLKYDRMRMSGDNNTVRAEGDMPRTNEKASRLALAAWVTKHNQIVPIQATGGWLP